MNIFVNVNGATNANVYSDSNADAEAGGSAIALQASIKRAKNKPIKF